MSVKAAPAKSPKPPPKKPERFKEEEVAEALRAARGFVSAAARRLACDPTTIRDYMERYPALRIVRHEAREEEKDVAELKLGQAIRNGEAWAICFYLKTQAKDRGYVERLTIANPDGSAIDFVGDAKRDVAHLDDAATYLDRMKDAGSSARVLPYRRAS